MLSDLRLVVLCRFICWLYEARCHQAEGDDEWNIKSESLRLANSASLHTRSQTETISSSLWGVSRKIMLLN
ncbi:hypothetical protein AOLI_G00081530 [Acnodon oligacanthus]